MKDQWVIVTDVDGTLTAPTQGALVRIVIERHMPPETVSEMNALRERYMGPVAAGALSAKEELVWLQRTFQAYVRHGLHRRAWEEALEEVKFRDEAVEMLHWCSRHEIPVAAVSYGCADFIEFVAKRNGISFSRVYAGRLMHADSVVIGYEEGSLTTPAVKGVCSRDFADKCGVPYKRIIAIGDTGGDRYLGHLKEQRLGIAETEACASELRALGIMDEVHVGTFRPVLSSIQRRIGLP